MECENKQDTCHHKAPGQGQESSKASTWKRFFFFETLPRTRSASALRSIFSTMALWPRSRALRLDIVSFACECGKTDSDESPRLNKVAPSVPRWRALTTSLPSSTARPERTGRAGTNGSGSQEGRSDYLQPKRAGLQSCRNFSIFRLRTRVRCL